ncbi:MAG: WD40 repeat domain-containing protein [Cyanobacteria bacterium P01_A01_bin.84]
MTQKHLSRKILISKVLITSVVTAAISTSSINLPSWAIKTEKKNQSSKVLFASKSGDNSQTTRSLRGHIWSIASLAFTSDGKTLVSGSFDHTIKVWNLKTGKMVRTLDFHKDGVNSVVLTPDAKLLVSAGGAAQTNTDTKIKVWDLNQGKLVRTLKGHKMGVKSLLILPDGQTLISASYDKTIKVWNLRTGKLLRTLIGHKAWVKTLALSPDGKILASGGGSPAAKTDRKIRIWDLSTGKLLKTLTGNSYPINFLSFSNDGNTLISGNNRKIKLWDLNRSQVQNQFTVSQLGDISSITASPDKETLVITSLNGGIELWNLKTGKQVDTLVKAVENPQNFDRLYPSTTAFSPDGKTLAVGYGGAAELSNFSINLKVWK